MNSNAKVKLTISFNDPDLNSEEQDHQVQKLLAELRQVDEIDEVSRVIDPNPPKGNKSLGGFLMGLLTVEVNPSNAKKVISFLGDRLSGKTIEVSIEGNGRKLTVKANSREEMEFAIKQAKDFLAL